MLVKPIILRGQIETPAKSLSSLVIIEDTEVLIAISSCGLYVLDPVSTATVVKCGFASSEVDDDAVGFR